MQLSRDIYSWMSLRALLPLALAFHHGDRARADLYLEIFRAYFRRNQVPGYREDPDFLPRSYRQILWEGTLRGALAADSVVLVDHRLLQQRAIFLGDLPIWLRFDRGDLAGGADLALLLGRTDFLEVMILQVPVQDINLGWDFQLLDRYPLFAAQLRDYLRSRLPLPAPLVTPVYHLAAYLQVWPLSQPDLPKQYPNYYLLAEFEKARRGQTQGLADALLGLSDLREVMDSYAYVPEDDPERLLRIGLRELQPDLLRRFLQLEAPVLPPKVDNFWLQRVTLDMIQRATETLALLPLLAQRDITVGPWYRVTLQALAGQTLDWPEEGVEKQRVQLQRLLIGVAHPEVTVELLQNRTEEDHVIHSLVMYDPVGFLRKCRKLLIVKGDWLKIRRVFAMGQITLLREEPIWPQILKILPGKSAAATASPGRQDSS